MHQAGFATGFMVLTLSCHKHDNITQLTCSSLHSFLIFIFLHTVVEKNIFGRLTFKTTKLVPVVDYFY